MAGERDAVKATEILKKEHHDILLVIAAAEKEVQFIDKTNTIHAYKIRRMMDFFSTFVDRCHHGKEEKYLFVRIHKHGIPIESGPLASLISRHEQERACVDAVRTAVAGRNSNCTEAIMKARENLEAYVSLLREHIEKENNVLYPMVDCILDSREQASLCHAFDKVKRKELGKGVQKKYHSWIEKLAGN